MVERILEDFKSAFDLEYVSLRYFNAAGADPDGELGEDHKPEIHLIPLVLQVDLCQSDKINIFGDDYSTRGCAYYHRESDSNEGCRKKARGSGNPNWFLPKSHQ